MQSTVFEKFINNAPAQPLYPTLFYKLPEMLTNVLGIIAFSECAKPRRQKVHGEFH